MKKKKNFFHELIRSSIFVLGVLIIALTYNTLIIPNDLVVGGSTGLSIIFNKLFGWNVSMFILVFGLILLLISFIFLGFETTKRNIIGTFVYPLLLSLTVPIANFLIPHFKFDDFIVLVLLGGTFLGLGAGLVYKAGYTTGGFDIIMQLMNKYLKIPEGKAAKISNLIVVVASMPLIGLTTVVYSSLTLVYEEILVNKITIGISDSKLFFIYSRKIDDIRDSLVRDGKFGFTIIPTVGGYSHYKGEMLMCVVSTSDYYAFREIVLNTDPNAFFVIDDCYEVNGGVKRQHLPFL